MEGFFISELMKHVDRQAAVITTQVYLELCEVKKYYDLAYSYNSELKTIIITARKTRKGPICSFVAITDFQILSFGKIQHILNNISCSTIYVVIVHSDSTSVYYQIAEGLLEPTDTSAKHLKENKQEKLDSDLRKHREVLEHAALLGISVTINKEAPPDNIIKEQKTGQMNKITEKIT